jgi:hypothetical protein
MASTRNKNTKEDYRLQQNQFEKQKNYNSYENGFQGKAYNACLPSLGFNPSRMAMETLSYNPIDIETNLFGIGSNNLHKPAVEFKPELKQLKNLEYFETQQVIMPKIFIQDTTQRPFPI